MLFEVFNKSEYIGLNRSIIEIKVKFILYK